jgi:hypothetical protein
VSQLNVEPLLEEIFLEPLVHLSVLDVRSHPNKETSLGSDLATKVDGLVDGIVCGMVEDR